MVGRLKNLSLDSYSYEEEEAIYQCSFVLPIDLIVEILQRLPVKSLLRFQSTSKPWLQLIRSSKFIAKHLTHHQQQKKKGAKVNFITVYGVPSCTHNVPPFSLCYCTLDTYSSATISQGILLISKGDDEGRNMVSCNLAHSLHYFGCQSISIVGSCNGLVCIKFCFSTRGRSNGDYYRDRGYGIWNPATRKFKLLPALRPLSSSEFEYLENIVVGFSYISGTCCYKLVQILVFAKYGQDKVKRFSARVEVLNVGENSWREVVCQGQDEAIHELGRETRYIEPSKYYIHNDPVVANGCLNWLGFLEDGKVILVSFDLNKEVFTQSALPHPNGLEIKLAVFEDNLAAFVYSQDSSNENEEYFDVWNYEGMSQSWKKQFSVGPLPKYHRPIGFWADGEIIVMGKLKEFWFEVKEAYLYEVKDKEKKDFPSSEKYSNMHFESYVESLVDF